MRIVLAVVALAVAALVWVSLQTSSVPAAEQRAATPVVADATIAGLFFGDSYFNVSEYVPKVESIGFLAADALGYWPMIDGAGGTGFAAARPATETAVAKPRYDRQIARLETIYPPRVIVLQGGLNDRDHGRVQDDAERTIDLVKRKWPGVPVVLVGPVDLPGADPVAVDVAAAAKSRRVPFVDAREWDLQGRLGPDGVHPTKAGSRQLAKELLADLIRVGVKEAKSLPAQP